MWFWYQLLDVSWNIIWWSIRIIGAILILICICYILKYVFIGLKKVLKYIFIGSKKAFVWIKNEITSYVKWLSKEEKKEEKIRWITLFIVWLFIFIIWIIDIFR